MKSISISSAFLVKPLHIVHIVSVLQSSWVHINGIDPDHRLLGAIEINPHVLLPALFAKMRSCVGQRLFNYCSSNIDQPLRDQRPSYEREILSSGQQHLIQPDLISIGGWPVALHNDYVPRGDFELLSAQLNHGKKSSFGPRFHLFLHFFQDWSILLRRHQRRIEARNDWTNWS